MHVVVKKFKVCLYIVLIGRVCIMMKSRTPRLLHKTFTPLRQTYNNNRFYIAMKGLTRRTIDRDTRTCGVI